MPTRGSAIGAGFGAIADLGRHRSGTPSMSGSVPGTYRVPSQAAQLPPEIPWLWLLVAVEISVPFIIRKVFNRDHAG